MITIRRVATQYERDHYRARPVRMPFLLALAVVLAGALIGRIV